MRTDHSHKPEKRGPPDVLIRLLASADVRFDGDRPWDIQVRDPAFYDRVLRRGTLGFGESYMDQAWESERLDETFNKLLRADLNTKARSLVRLRFLGAILRSFFFNRQSRQRAFQVGEHHYDIGNDVYTAMRETTRSCKRSIHGSKASSTK